ncbi:T9SS type A sorting domain-containing protein [Aureibacter tunicatorum]|uniref:Secretion system C-terminal sorting domain-containing protein n=1 Tax=Aureibacter tunicatorum TaxID=866807 RepID=A0AAE3XIP4_9BACT|nr:T9SS type A sorting domain-containing protein [Aureibacter tunicatorum]MDR6237127.1 hypothetical protein [Aureibacter tunicatorum]BDD06119.1 hypothetical protein AUTU_36020 [Aureibacter tunicatorum]
MKIAKAVILFIFFSFCAINSYGQTEQPFIGLKNMKNRVQLFSSPTSSILSIKIDDANFDNLQFKVYNIVGNEVDISVETVKKNNYYRIPTSKFASGYYFLVLKDEKTRFQEALKFSKTRD